MTKQHAKVRITGVLTYDAKSMHDDDPQGLAWFMSMLMDEDLILHSNELGDSVGHFKITKATFAAKRAKGETK